jgi:hypothetical protein
MTLVLVIFFILSLALVFKLYKRFVKFNFISDLFLSLLLASIFAHFIFSNDNLVLNGNSIYDQLDSTSYIQDFITYHVFMLVLIALRKWTDSSIRIKLVFGSLIWTVGLLLSSISLYLIETTQNNFLVSSSQQYSNFKYSNSGDTLFVVLDSLQGTHFDEILIRYPSETNFLNGFKYFPDTIASYPTTRGSSTNFSTGSINLNNQQVQSHLETQNHFIDYFKENMYTLDLSVSPIGGLEYNFNETDIARSNSPLLPKTLSEIVIVSINQLEIALFKVAPNVVKPYIYNGGKWLISERLGTYSGLLMDVDNKFLKEFEANASQVKSEKKSFHFYHLRGAHLPIRNIEDYPQFDLQPSEDPLLDNSRIALYKLRTVLEKLKAMQLQDSLEIVVISDHGYGAAGVRSSPEEANFEFEVAQAAADAVLLFKPRNSIGNLEISNVPMSLSDVPCLLTSGEFVSGCSAYGPNIWKTLNEGNIRRFFNYDWSHEAWRSAFLPPLEEFFVNGDSNVIANWGKVELDNDPRKPADLDYVPIGSALKFGDDEVSKYLILNGFAAPEGTHRWSLGSMCDIAFKLKPEDSKSGVKIEIGIAPLQNTQIGRQLRVFINKKYFKSIVLKNPLVPTLLDIPEKFINGKDIRIAFETPGNISPRIMNNSPDERLLGRAFTTLKVLERKQ